MKIIWVFVIFFACVASFAQKAYAPAGAERTAILECLRTKVSASVKKRPVKFVVRHLKAQNGWAFMSGRCVKPDGSDFDYKGTQFEAAIQQGIFDDWVCALMKKVKGKWQIKAWALGATDVPWAGWWGDFGAPEAIFPPHGNFGME